MATETLYTIEELTRAARKIFKQSGALVAAALKMTGEVSFTIKRAKKIIKKFARERAAK